MFFFRGPVLASKSWLNRTSIIRYFNSGIATSGGSDSEDVLNLKKAIDSIGHTDRFDLGMGGTSFRFFVFLISRQPGSWTLKAHDRLLERPQQEIIKILNQLGVSAEFCSNGLHIMSQGWNSVDKVVCSANLSSQFVSGLLLSCWKLDFDLEVEIKKPIISFGYLQMTLKLLLATGMNLEVEEKKDALICRIPKNQKTQVQYLQAEPDISSAFSLIAAAVINGNIEITNWMNHSEQPDLIFLHIFDKMNISFKIIDQLFLISKHDNWKPVNYNLNSSPDLFPVLSVLCAFADGVSTLTGANQLKHKESDRIKKTHELLGLAGIRTEMLEDGLRIYGQSSINDMNTKLSFNPDHDHRMAMAAGLLKLKGYNIELSDPEVVNKSYPSFWKDTGLNV